MHCLEDMDPLVWEIDEIPLPLASVGALKVHGEHSFEEHGISCRR